MKFKKLLIIPVIIGAASLAGCSSDSAKRVDLNLKYVPADTAPASNNAGAQAQVAQASTSVSRSLQELSAIQEAKHPGVKLPREKTAGGLSRQGSLNWNGPVEPAVKKVASAAGYRLRVLGSRPAVPVIVNINARNKSLGTILRNIKFQATPKATIVTYPSTRVIELRYNK